MISSATLRRALPAAALGAALLVADLPPAHAAPTPASATTLASASIAAPSTPAAATAPGVAADGGSVTFTGRGFGHGRGMSQWGAYGAATSGLTWSQIIAFYYPGARSTTTPDTELRVWVSRDDDGVTQVPPQPGLKAVVGRTQIALPTGPGYTAWRVVPAGSLAALEHRDAAGRWTRLRRPTTSAVVFRAGERVGVTMPSGTTEQFSGRVIGSVASGKVLTVVSTSLETYLRGVVPHEMPASWHPEAVAAQAVAARTYAASYRSRQRAKGAPWDICDSTVCQVYKPASQVSRWGTRTVLDDPRADAAVAATAGTVLTTPTGGFVHAEFSASDGGQTVDGGAFAQVAKADPYDALNGNPNAAWTRTVPAATIARGWGLGVLRDIEVTGRDGLGADGGRVTRVRLTGSARTVEVSGDRMRQVLGLRSSWFTPTRTAAAGRPAAAVVPHISHATAYADADWTGDHVADRVSVSGGRIVVRRGLRGGRFSPAATVAGAPAGIWKVVGAADVTGDRRTDLVTVDTTGRLVVLVGDGRGRVTRTVRHGVGWSGMRSFSVADVTGDGRADLRVTTSGGARITYTGTSTGRFVRR